MSDVILFFRDPADKSDPPTPIPVLPSGRAVAAVKYLLLGPQHVVGLHAADAPCRPECFGKNPNIHADILWSPGFNR
jgi:hypothetical protein